MERNFLVMWIDHEDAEREVQRKVMTDLELVHFIDMQDYVNYEYRIFEVTEFDKPQEIWYKGWQPDCVIEFVDADGNTVMMGWGTDH